jgi:hypothetical protein
MAFRLLGTQGRACRECAKEYYRDANRMCQPCDDHVWVLYLIGFLAAAAMLPLLLRLSKSQSFMSINIFVGTMQARPQLFPIPYTASFAFLHFYLQLPPECQLTVHIMAMGFG